MNLLALQERCIFLHLEEVAAINFPLIQSAPCTSASFFWMAYSEALVLFSGVEYKYMYNTILVVFGGIFATSITLCLNHVHNRRLGAERESVGSALIHINNTRECLFAKS